MRFLFYVLDGYLALRIRAQRLPLIGRWVKVNLAPFALVAAALSGCAATQATRATAPDSFGERAAIAHASVVSIFDVLIWVSVAATLASFLASRLIPTFRNGRLAALCALIVSVAVALRVAVYVAGPTLLAWASFAAVAAAAAAMLPHVRFLLSHLRKEVNNAP